MCVPQILEDAAVPIPADYKTEVIAKKVFQMFSGEDHEIVLEAENHLMKKFIDKFGEHFESWPATDHSFRAKVTASISQTFYSWLFTYNGEINIIGPQDIQDQYIQMLTKLTDTAKTYIES